MMMLVAVAGGLGALLRHLVSAADARIRSNRTPLGTAIVNVTGSLILGIVAGLALSVGSTDDARAVIGLGLLGGYTTFSTAMVEAVHITQRADPSGSRRPPGSRRTAWYLTIGTLLAAVAAAAVGLWFGMPLGGGGGS